MDTKDHISKAIELAGGAAKVAALFGLKTSWAVYKWEAAGIPAERVIPLSRHIGWEVTPHQMLPSIYPDPLDGLPAELRPVPSSPEDRRTNPRKTAGSGEVVGRAA